MHRTIFLWAAMALCAVAPQAALAQAAPTAQKEAQQLFEQGATHFRARRFDKASEFFQRAYNIDPSPILLYNLARAAEEMGKADNAVGHYRAYLVRYEGAEDRAEVERRIRVLEAIIEASKPKPGRLFIEDLPQSATLMVDGAEPERPDDDGAWPLEPGPHSVAVAAPGLEPWTMEVEVRSLEATRVHYGEGLVPKLTRLFIDGAPVEATVTIDGKPAPDRDGEGAYALPIGAHDLRVAVADQPDWRHRVELAVGADARVQYTVETPPPPPPKDFVFGMSKREFAGWTCVGAGTVSLAVGAVFGLSSASAVDDYESQNDRLRDYLIGNSSLSPDEIEADEEFRSIANARDSAQDDARSSALLSNVFLGVAAAGLIAGGTLLTLEYMDEPSDDPAADDSPRASVVPMPGGFGIVGRF